MTWTCAGNLSGIDSVYCVFDEDPYVTSFLSEDTVQLLRTSTTPRTLNYSELLALNMPAWSAQSQPDTEMLKLFPFTVKQ